MSHWCDFPTFATTPLCERQQNFTGAEHAINWLSQATTTTQQPRGGFNMFQLNWIRLKNALQVALANLLNLSGHVQKLRVPQNCWVYPWWSSHRWGTPWFYGHTDSATRHPRKRGPLGSAKVPAAKPCHRSRIYQSQVLIDMYSSTK